MLLTYAYETFMLFLFTYTLLRYETDASMNFRYWWASPLTCYRRRCQMGLPHTFFKYKRYYYISALSLLCLSFLDIIRRQCKFYRGLYNAWYERSLARSFVYIPYTCRASPIISYTMRELGFFKEALNNILPILITFSECFFITCRRSSFREAIYKSSQFWLRRNCAAWLNYRESRLTLLCHAFKSTTEGKAGFAW